MGRRCRTWEVCAAGMLGEFSSELEAELEVPLRRSSGIEVLPGTEEGGVL